jgi:hypothetical protein
MKNWYELSNKEKYDLYNSTSVQQFWDWWSDKEEVYMEVRIKDFELMKSYADKYRVPMSASGLFIKSGWQLEKILNYFKNKCVIWFGINPKRYILNKYKIPKISGKDINLHKLKFLFVDIDRKIKDGAATNQDLMNADFLANKLLEELGQAGFNKNYCKICSGNGVQLLIKLDVPIEFPKPNYTDDGKLFVEGNLFLETKNVIKDGIGKILPGFSVLFEEEYGVEIDSTCFNAGRVGALPGSFNLKYDKMIPRGIVELKQDEQNLGLSDYLNDLYKSRKSRIRTKKSYEDNQNIIELTKEYEIKSNTLQKNNIVDLMLKHTFPNGGINNTLWYCIKILLHANGICNTDNEYLQIHEQLKKLHDRTFSDNGLEPHYKNNYNGPIKIKDINTVPYTVNKYLRMNKIQKDGINFYHKPIFPVSPKGKIIEHILIELELSLLKKQPEQDYKLEIIKDDPINDIKQLQSDFFKIRRGDGINESLKISDYKFTEFGTIIVQDMLRQLFVDFMVSYRKKWGDEIAAYMMKYYMNDYLNYKRF